MYAIILWPHKFACVVGETGSISLGSKSYNINTAVMKTKKKKKNGNNNNNEIHSGWLRKLEI